MKNRHNRLSRIRKLLMEPLEDRRVLTPIPVLVADINPGPESSGAGGGLILIDQGGPTASATGKVLFAADGGPQGNGLYFTDDTATGTGLAMALPGNSFPKPLAVVGSKFFFTTFNSPKLWVTTGSPGGTQLVKEMTEVGAATSFNGRLFFGGTGVGDQGNELWTSDGTAAGTQLFLNLRFGLSEGSASTGGSHPRAFVPYHGLLYFQATTGSVSGLGIVKDEAWVTDGTVAGTRRLADVLGGTGVLQPTNYLVSGDNLYFIDSGQSPQNLWVTDGTPAGTRQLTLLPTDSLASSFVDVNGTLFFSVESGPELSPDMDLWKSDGTPTGTVVVKKIMQHETSPSPGLSHGRLHIFLPENINGKLAFFVPRYAEFDENYSDYFARELWVSDGTSTGTRLIHDFGPPVNGTLPINGSMTVQSGQVIFSAYDPQYGVEPWSFDGQSAGLLADLNPGAASSSPFFWSSSGVYFSAFDAAHGRELWRLAIPTDDRVTVAQGSTDNLLNVLANDNDPRNGSLHIASVTPTSLGGSVTIDASQRLVYRPPAAVGTDSFSYTVANSYGNSAPVNVTVTVASTALVVPAESSDSQALSAALAGAVVTAEQNIAAGGTEQVVLNVNPSNFTTVVQAVNLLSMPQTGNQPVVIVLSVSDGAYPGAFVSVPQGVTLVVDGNLRLFGASPALTVASGDVVLKNATRLSNDTNAPTILVTGGHLTVRNSVIEATPGLNQTAIRIVGAGTADLGTISSAGGNMFIVHGGGLFVDNETSATIGAFGNRYFVDNQVARGTTLQSRIVGPVDYKISVQVDIKPGDATNSLNLASNGVLSVAVGSTSTFDARGIAASSVLFAGAYASQSSWQDVNGDGKADLVLQFRLLDIRPALLATYGDLLRLDLADGSLSSSHQTATELLSGETVDHVLIEGFDTMDLFFAGKALKDLLASF